MSRGKQSEENRGTCVGAFLDETELYLFNEGTNAYAYRALGCHKVSMNGYEAYRFAVWAPNAEAVSVVGSFNEWNENADPMHRCGETGVWEVHIGIAHMGDLYKYAIRTFDGDLLYKADPYAFFCQQRPATASVVWELEDYAWRDEAHMAQRARQVFYDRPVNIYEVHAGSWKAGLSYEDMAEQLVRYVKDMGYTHVEFMPLYEYPLDDSWGYQVTGYYAITSRYGTPQQFKYLIDCCHRAGLYVIMDWVPAHFPRDAHGLRLFDGTPVYESADPRRSEQRQWGTLLFDYGRAEVQSFLISNAVFLLNEYHIDGLRVDAVSCMLYLDYGRTAGEWAPNSQGGRENLEAIAFLQNLTEAVRRESPGAILIAEESTAFPLVTAWPDRGGLGFDFKWNMGFMNDTLEYMSMDSLFRKDHHDMITFSMCYAFSENHVLPFSHDEVVHGKCSLINRMPGPYEDQFRQMRLLMMYQFAHPGKKLNFMGNEFAQFIEWDFRQSLDWFLLNYPAHSDFQSFSRALNHFYIDNPALWACDTSWDGFQWISVEDDRHSVIAFLRMDERGDALLCAFNFTPVDHAAYRLEMPYPCQLEKAMSGVDVRPLQLTSAEDKAGVDVVALPLWSYEAVYYYVKKLPPKRAKRAKAK